MQPDINKLASVVKAITLDAVYAPKIIYEKPLHLLGFGDKTVDIASDASPERYRLVDCRAFSEEKVLRIYEYTQFPTDPYCTISYVWRNVRSGESFVKRGDGVEFAVKGAEDADPIHTEVLHHACVAALQKGCTYLWLDRLCIIQTSKQDKRWQIKDMYRIYRSCSLCIVLAGGLQYMVSLEDETVWIHRGWTLQEALAPPDVQVLFSWRLPSGKARAGQDGFERIEHVVPYRSAIAPLSFLLKSSSIGVTQLFVPDNDKSLSIETKIFDTYPLQHTYNDIPFWRPTRKILAPNVAALCVAMDASMDEDTRLYAIWQSALMRTSSRPVDMVFSIMGLFGVTLDPKSFHERDRLGATIALARAILAKGGRATWLGLSFKLPPCKQLPTFAVFPQTRVSGKALVNTYQGAREVSEMMDNEYHCPEALVRLPQGSMDEEGYLTFAAKAVRLEPTNAMDGREGHSVPLTLRAKDKSIWRVCPSNSPHSGDVIAFAVLLGWFNIYFPGQTPSDDTKNIRAMLVVEHAPGRYHIRSYFFLSIRLRSWVCSDTWREHSFSVGPQTKEPINEEEHELVEVPIPDLQLMRSAPNKKMSANPSLMDLAARQARWAVPQHTLEKRYGQ